MVMASRRCEASGSSLVKNALPRPEPGEPTLSGVGFFTGQEPDASQRRLANTPYASAAAGSNANTSASVYSHSAGNVSAGNFVSAAAILTASA